MFWDEDEEDGGLVSRGFSSDRRIDNTCFSLNFDTTLLFCLSPFTPRPLDSEALGVAAERTHTPWLWESLAFRTKVTATSDSGTFAEEAVAFYSLTAVSNRDSKFFRDSLSPLAAWSTADSFVKVLVQQKEDRYGEWHWQRRTRHHLTE